MYSYNPYLARDDIIVLKRVKQRVAVLGRQLLREPGSRSEFTEMIAPVRGERR